MTRIKRLLMPGIVFQSILVGGGYASGREIMEYSAKLGSNGALTILLTAVLFMIFMYLAFQLARSTQSFDYGSWSKQLIGKLWPLFDVLFLVMSIIAIAVVIATAGTTLQIQGKIPYVIATGLVIGFMFTLSFFGKTWIAHYKSLGTIILYAVFIYLCISILTERGHKPASDHLALVSEEWVTSGFIYAGYNFVVIPACLFTIAGLESKNEVLYASIFGAILGIVPMALLYLVLVGEPGLVTEPLPFLVLIKTYLSPNALGLYYVVLLWTLIETGVGLTHAITDRVSNQLCKKTGLVLSGLQRALMALGFALISVLMAQVGLITLVAEFYSIMAWGFLALFALPLIYRAPLLLRAA